MDAEHDLGWQAPSMAADPEEAGILIEEDRAMDGLVGQLLGMDVDPPPPLVSADGEWQYVHLKVKGQDGKIVHFKLKRTTRIRKLLESYCTREHLQLEQTRFMFNGQPLTAGGFVAPDALEMEDGDVIDAYGPDFS
mmetsp:Transcript_12066/g.29307  ORF Transcript_12066/g.29307 Transcript_12066/m.29307 type:complete len:136 (-) Transcript_12066:438-845(-)